MIAVPTSITDQFKEVTVPSSNIDKLLVLRNTLIDGKMEWPFGKEKFPWGDVHDIS